MHDAGSMAAPLMIIGPNHGHWVVTDGAAADSRDGKGDGGEARGRSTGEKHEGSRAREKESRTDPGLKGLMFLAGQKIPPLLLSLVSSGNVEYRTTTGIMDDSWTGHRANAMIIVSKERERKKEKGKEKETENNRQTKSSDMENTGKNREE